MDITDTARELAKRGMVGLLNVPSQQVFVEVGAWPSMYHISDRASNKKTLCGKQWHTHRDELTPQLESNVCKRCRGINANFH